MSSPVAAVRRARRILGCAGSVALGATLLAALTPSTAAGQEDRSTTTVPTSTTSTTGPPVTVLLDDGDIGVVPPGADEQPPPPGQPGAPDGSAPDTDAPPPDSVGDPLGPDEENAEIDEELPVVVLPDPTPGLNAALAAIDVTRATERVERASLARRDAEARVVGAFTERRSAIAARRAAGNALLDAKAVIDQLAAMMVVRGDLGTLQPLFGEASLGELRDLELSEVAAAKVHADFEAARAAYREAVAVELAATDAVARASRREREAFAAELAARRAKDEAIAAAEEARSHLGPTVLGPAVLDADDLVAWYRTYYRADPPVAPIGDIIEAYLRVGGEEGVAGDVAFAQAILETGGFRSGHARGFNFAGIGAYDSCSPDCGFRFADLDGGVAAHIHLLRAYADPELTTAQLASTPNRLVAPERVGVRGCCQRWTQLTGVWATDPNYDRKVLGIYRLMVETARARDRAEL